MFNQDYFNNKFTYNTDTGILHYRGSRRKAGTVIRKGNVLHPRFVVIVQIKKKQYFAHRIIWIMVHGSIPDGYEIDHINHNSTDNRLENLRAVARIDNMRNCRLSIRNKSGTTGVRLLHTGLYQANIRVNKKAIYLGNYTSEADAINARKEAEIKYNFHPNHGTE